MKFELDPLPYATDALEPYISARTVDFHYNKHHNGYLEKLAKAIEGDPLADETLETLVIATEGTVFRNAAQVWNHSFYWNCMDPSGGGKPAESFAVRIESDIGGMDAFRQAFAEIAAGQFGSGWAWLVVDADGRLQVLSTHDADNPMRRGFEPILTLDVWEHAYYLDYQNDRAAYIDNYLDHLINWHFAEANYEVAAKRIAAREDAPRTMRLAL